MKNLETLDEYIKRLNRGKNSSWEFKICKTTKKLYQVGYGSLKYGKDIKKFQDK